MELQVIIIIITCVISVAAFALRFLMTKFQLNAWSVVSRKEYFRLLTYGFVHADFIHLLINMVVLWSFGRALIYFFDVIFAGNGSPMFLFLYISAIPISAIITVKKNKNNPNFNAVGASGAVSAIVYASIFLKPYSLLYLWGIPIPGILFGVAYLIYSWVMAKRNADNIGHDAHFWGAVYGFLFPGLLKFSLFIDFFKQLFFIN